MTFRLTLILTILAAAPIHAREFYVSQQHPQAADTAAGTREAPLKTISAAAKMAQAGDTVVVAAGIYRESVTLTNSGAAGKPIVFRSEEPRKAVISGADVVTDWKPASPGVWVRDIPDIRRNNDALPHGARGGQWVYANGVPMQYAETREQLSPGTFHIDFDARKLYFAALEDVPIAGARIEYAWREGLISPAAPLDDIHVSGFTLIHNANWFRGRDAITISGRRWRVEGNHVLWASYSGMSFRYTNGAVANDNIIEWSGAQNVGGGPSYGMLFENNIVRYGNWRRGNPSLEGGGSKWVSTIDSIVRGNEFYGNLGAGLWFDFNCCNNIYEGNTAHDNTIWGIFSEFNWEMIIRDNVSYNNWYGIMVAQNTGALVQRNILFNNGDGIILRGDARQPITPTPIDWVEKTFVQNVRKIPDIPPMAVERMAAGGFKMYSAPPVFQVNNSVFHENLAFDNTGPNYNEARNYAVPSPTDAFVNNFSDYNFWHFEKAENGFMHRGGAYAGGLEEWRKVSGRDKHSVQLKDHPHLSKELPAWAEAKRSSWAFKVRAPRELRQLGLLQSPEGQAAQIRASRSTRLEPVIFKDTSIRASRFDIDGKPVLGIWTGSPLDRKYIRLKLGTPSVTVENAYLQKSERKLQDGIIDLVVTFAPTYLHGIGETIEELPSNSMSVRMFNQIGEPVPVTATFVNSGTKTAALNATFSTSIGFKAEPDTVAKSLAPGQIENILVNLIPQGEAKKAPGQILLDAKVGDEKVVRMLSFGVGESKRKIPQAKRPIIVDGKLEDWGDILAKGLPVGVVIDKKQFANGKVEQWKGPGDLSGKVFTAWTPQMLYAAIVVEDDQIVPALKGGDPWGADAIEWFVDGRAFDMQWQKEPTPGCYQIGVSPGKGDVPPNTMVFQKTMAGLQSATSLTEKGYIVEIGIPLTDGNFPAGQWKEGRPFKMSVLFNDKDDSSAPMRKYTFGWAHSPNGSNVNDTTGWQTLTFDN